MNADYRKLVADCADQGRALAQRIAMDGVSEPLYLYARESTPDTPGRLFLVRDSAPNPYRYTLVTPEGLRTNVPYDRYYTWIYERAKQARIMPIGEA